MKGKIVLVFQGGSSGRYEYPYDGAEQLDAAWELAHKHGRYRVSRGHAARFDVLDLSELPGPPESQAPDAPLIVERPAP